MVKNARSTMKAQKMKNNLIHQATEGNLAPMIIGQNLLNNEEFKRSRHDSVAVNTEQPK